MQNTIVRITNNAIIIDKRRIVNSCAIISYVGLTIAKYLLSIATVIFAFLSVCAGGDGRIYDGNPKLAFTMLGMAFICILAMKASTMFRDIITKNVRKMNENCKKHRYMSKKR